MLLRSHTVWMPFDFESFRLRRFQMEHIRIIKFVFFSFWFFVLLKSLVVGISVLKYDDGLVWHKKNEQAWECKGDRDRAQKELSNAIQKKNQQHLKAKWKMVFMCYSTRAYVVVVAIVIVVRVVWFILSSISSSLDVYAFIPKSLLLCSLFKCFNFFSSFFFGDWNNFFWHYSLPHFSFFLILSRCRCWLFFFVFS